MIRHRKPVWLWLSYGRDWLMDIPHHLFVGLGLRPDLMTRKDDEGRMVLAAFAFDMSWGCYPESVMDGRPKWFFRSLSRSDIPEIAERLAGGPE
jgi:hypothetical protein